VKSPFVNWLLALSGLAALGVSAWRMYGADAGIAVVGLELIVVAIVSVAVADCRR
jgi:hypothetical protein